MEAQQIRGEGPGQKRVYRWLPWVQSLHHSLTPTPFHGVLFTWRETHEQLRVWLSSQTLPTPEAQTGRKSTRRSPAEASPLTNGGREAGTCLTWQLCQALRRARASLIALAISPASLPLNNLPFNSSQANLGLFLVRAALHTGGALSEKALGQNRFFNSLLSSDTGAKVANKKEAAFQLQQVKK